MNPYELLLLLVLLCVGLVLFDKARTAERRRRSRHDEFPRRWVAYLQKNVPIYARLPKTLKHDLQGLVRAFIDEKEFEACGGLEEVSEEMQVTIAAHACLLLLNKDGPAYARLRSILVYPGDYRGEDVYDEYDDEARSGESWSTGSVVLSWDAIERTAHDVKDGENLIIHEFAHQLDQEDGVSDGAPPLENASAYRAWARVFGTHYADLREKVSKGQRTDLDSYGATDPAEFFAVATEAFFERPKQLAEGRPDLYDQLKSFYRVDPQRWGGDSTK
ncbi:zinc-dependent peptidase [soil metagenome]